MLKSNWKNPQQWTFASNGPWHDLENKAIAQQRKVIEACHLLLACVKRLESELCKKSDVYRKKCSVLPRKTVWGHPPSPPPRCVRGLTKVFPSLYCLSLKQEGGRFSLSWQSISRHVLYSDFFLFKSFFVQHWRFYVNCCLLSVISGHLSSLR